MPWTYVICDLKCEKILQGYFRKKYCRDILGKKLQKTNQKVFRVEKVIKRKCDKLYIKWKEYNTFFNSQIEQKDIV